MLLGTLLATAARGQIPSPTGNLYGTALDPDGKPLEGVTVALTGPGAAQVASTDPKGDFHFLNLSPGTYSLVLARTDFETVHRDVVVALLRNAVLTISMPVAGATEVVIVSGEPAAVDNRKTQTGANFPRKELDEIPTTRDPWGVLRQVPGVLLDSIDTGGAYTGQQPTFVGKGSHADQNTYNLDGVAVSIAGFTPLYFDFDSLDSMGVVTGGSDPSLSSPGVTINLVTKRGTNEFHGSARGLYTDGARWDYGAEVGGPLWKDRVWLWGAGASNSYLSQTFFVYPADAPAEPLRYQETQDYWNAKLNAQPAPSNTVTLSYTKWQRFADGRGADWGDRSEQSLWDNTFPGESFRLEDSQVFSARLFASLDLSYLPADNVQTPKGGLGTQADQDVNYIWRNSFYESDTKGVQRQAGVTASAFFDTGDLRHELKFGFGYRQAHWNSATVWPADQLVAYATFEPIPQAAITRAANKRLLLHYYDTYLGDTIAAGNLTINVGLRFDYQQGTNLPSSVPANPTFPEVLPAVQYGGDSGYPITWRAIQPRLGATYAIGQDRRTLVRASYARFADQLALEIASINAFPGTAGLYYGWNDTNLNGRAEPAEIDFNKPQGWSNVNPDNPGSSAPLNQISKSLEPPTTKEFIVGVERQIFSDLSASIAYTHRSLGNPEFAPLIGTSRSSYVYRENATGTVVDPTTGFVLNFSEPYYALTTDPPPLGFEIRNRPDTRETYDGIELQVIKAFSHGWMLRVSLAYNNWQQHIGPGAIVDPNNETPGTNANGPVVDSGSVGNGFGGGSIINATWQFNVSGMVELPLGIQAGLNLFGRQGFPTPYWVEAVPTGDTTFSRPAIQIGQATDYRTPNVYVLDLQLSKVFMIGSWVAVSPVVACFNILNSHTVLAREGRVGTYDSSQTPAFFPNTGDGGTFNTPIETLSGRTIRGGVRISF
jgi:hypothetical protein